MSRPTTKQEAQVILNTLWAKRPALKKLIDDTVLQAKQDHFVQNHLGRVCRVPVGFEYKALNWLDQGETGDLMRWKLVSLDELIKAKKLPVKMLLTVHDEVDFKCKKKDALEVIPILAEEFVRIPFMKVPVLCDIEVGQNWGELQKWDDFKQNLLA